MKNSKEKELLYMTTEAFNAIMASDDLNIFYKLDGAYREMYILLVAAWLIDDPTEEVKLIRVELSEVEVQRLSNYVGKTIYRWYDDDRGVYYVFVKDAIKSTFHCETIEKFKDNYCYGGNELNTYEPIKVEEEIK